MLKKRLSFNITCLMTLCLLGCSAWSSAQQPSILDQQGKQLRADIEKAYRELDSQNFSSHSLLFTPLELSAIVLLDHLKYWVNPAR